MRVEGGGEREGEREGGREEEREGGGKKRRRLGLGMRGEQMV